VSLRILTWNLMHGRAVPSAGRNLFDEFAAALAGWEWDLALLQEVPPWWPERLATEHALGLTSRNFGLPVRRWLAERWPDAIKSGGGGCNATLVHRHRIVQHRPLRLRWLPERRWLLGVELDVGLWVGNLHASGRGIAEVHRAAEALTAWADGAPAILGGDFNLRDVTLPGFVSAGGPDVDDVLLHGLTPTRSAEVLERGHLSDHAPVLIHVAMPAGPPAATRAGPRAG
jgi:endonuclease/exonuclease/phosphatase family metal-dependent hydrolase